MSNNLPQPDLAETAGVPGDPSPSGRAARLDPRAALAIVAWVGGLALALTLDDPRLRYPAFLAAYGASALGWLGLVRWGRAAPFGLIVALGLALRAWAWVEPPAFSEDVFRYVYEGRLVWHLGPGAPFAHAPAEGPALGLPDGLLDEAWLRINHPEISTIYPPFAQLVFAAAGGVGLLLGHTLLALKALLVLADLGVWALLARALKKQGRPVAESVAWGACPLVILEVAREGHADSLSALGLALGLYGFTAARPKLGYAGWALAALAKLNGLLVLPAAIRTTRRGLGVAVAMCALLATPWLLAGPSAGVGLGEYATRWRAGDGAFTALLGLAEALLGGDWARIAGVTVTRHQLARAFTALGFVALLVLTLRRPAPEPAVPARAGVLLFGLLLLAPTLHPWYVTWLLPFAAAAAGFSGRRAVLLLATLAPLLHHPGWLELLDGRWRDLGWVRALVHLPVWGLWAFELVRAAKFGYPAAARRV